MPWSPKTMRSTTLIGQHAALVPLGAKLDGVLRNHSINLHPGVNGALRDTCVYSIIASDWPSVKAHLTYRLAR